jgi:hypothetical protein
MAAPVNVTAALAFDVGASLPFDITQDTHDLGTTYEVWWKYTVQPGDGLASIWAFGDLIGYFPRLRIYSDVGVTQILDTGFSGDRAKPLNIWLVQGNTYHFRITPNTGNPSPAVVNLTGLAAPTNVTGEGVDTLIYVNDDGDPTFSGSGAHMVILSGDDGDDNNFLGAFHPFPSGESGAIIHSENSMLWANAVTDELERFTVEPIAKLGIVAGRPGPGFDFGLSANNVTKKYLDPEGSVPVVGYLINPDGSVDAKSHDIGNHGGTLVASGTNNTNTVLYFATSVLASGIGRWDMVNDVQLTDLWPGETGNRVCGIEVLSDGTVAACIYVFGASWRIFHFAEDGTILNTIGPVTTSFPGGTFPRIARSPVGDPEQIWIWWHPITAETPNGISRFQRYQLSDGTLLSSVDHQEYEFGRYQGDFTDTPNARFGNSYSCQFVVVREAGGGGGTPVPSPPGPGEPGYPGITLPIRRQRATPHINDEQTWSFYSRFQLDVETGVGLESGQGVDPMVMMDYSDDGGQSFSNEQWRSAGALGDNRRRLLWRRLGRSRDRVFRITVTDPVKWFIVDGYVNAIGGTS